MYSEDETGGRALRRAAGVKDDHPGLTAWYSTRSIGEASFRVGYHSHSQFTRDYRHHFGRLPLSVALSQFVRTLLFTVRRSIPSRRAVSS